MKKRKRFLFTATAGKYLIIALTVCGLVSLAAFSLADVVDRDGPGGTVPNPGTQQQELANITAPAPYNTFEFVGTCAACHGGDIDQMAGHFSNWAGSSMASAARDPIFRANQIGVEIASGEVGAGNMCFRCHSPNGWTSGRFDPQLAGGDPKGSTMIHSILLSTDDEGILCEACHRTIGNVEFKSRELDPNDPAWNMLASVDDWPHAGVPFRDQAGDPTIAEGEPYGDTSLQFNDGMTYIGKYSGSVDIYFSDSPLPGTPYTGQTYGVDPDGSIFYAADGSVPLHYELPIGPPLQGQREIYDAQAISLEHPTAGDRGKLKPQPVPPGNTFVKSPEFCGSCHELVIPILNHGMPEQRTYSEWRFSDFGEAYANDPESGTRCQDCHMPTMMHEFADDARVSLNPDGPLVGWYPYAKDRNPNGGTAFHKFAGANRDLPMMMKFLYPEPDLELIGARTGTDPRIFPGMLSTRDPMYDRAQRNTEISLSNAVDVAISQAPTWNEAGGYWEVKVKVTNTSGHRIPSGYPDGRRFWIELAVSDAAGGTVYQSGHYDELNAELHTDPVTLGLNRALEPLIDAASGTNAVMVYERVTGLCSDATGPIFPDPDPENRTPTSCTPSTSLLNNFILFDNRILPQGFDYARLRQAGVKLWNHDVNMVPYEDDDRYPAGQNWDEVTYRFSGTADQVLTARAEVYWQTHTREFMEHLREQDTSTVRPEGPINAFMPGYPDTANYLSEEIELSKYTALDGTPLQDNWGGIAYAAWLETGKGAPYLAAVADTAVTAAPGDPVVTVFQGGNPYDATVSWDSVAGADGYLVFIRYGVAEDTASWDELAVVYEPATTLELTALKVSKSYGFAVQAFNAAGYSPGANAVDFTTTSDAPAAPVNLTVVSTAPANVELTWFDMADNETGFEIQRQTVAEPPGDFVTVATTTTPGDGSVNWIDTDPNLVADNCYVYQVAAYNASGLSTWTFPVTACIGSAPDGTVTLDPIGLAAGSNELSWVLTANTTTMIGFLIERTNLATNAVDTFRVNDPLATSFSDFTADPAVGYCYVVYAYNFVGNSAPSNMECTTTAAPPAAPSNLEAVFDPGLLEVSLTWLDNATTEDEYVVEVSMDNGPFMEIVRLPAESVAHVDSAVENGHTYVYRVAAVSLANGMSAYSNLATVVTGEIPQAPSGLVITRVRKDSIQFSWLDNATNEEGYHVEKSLNGVDFVRIDTLPADAVSYTDGNLVRKTTYWYRVQAFNFAGESGYTDEVSGTTK